ncbi:ABC transporter ATP-binding protein, partial [[Eubacterium] cellulosolvens]
MIELQDPGSHTPLVEMKGVTKSFPGVLACDHVDFDVRSHEIHALLGENGAGKTTLMNILYGLYQPDEGEILLGGRRVTINSPRAAIELGIGMVHQHFKLIPTLTVTENMVLGLRSSKGPFLDLDVAEKRIGELSKRYALEVDPKARIWQLSVGEQQRVEIIKALYRGAKVLIMDELTSVLTPQETEELMGTLKRMALDGLAVIPFVTHKLREVMAVSDRVTVMRRGKVVATIGTKDTDQKDLAMKMVGRLVFLEPEAPETASEHVVLHVEGLRALNDKGLLALDAVTFNIRSGEILGIAGVAGNGQPEMAEVITGLRKATAGRVLIDGKDITNKSPREIMKTGIGHIPEKRIESGLVPTLSVRENLILTNYDDPSLSTRFFLKRDSIDRNANKLIDEYAIMTPSKDTEVRLLSGGNLQRLILAREITRTNLNALVAVYPTRGLDVGATEFIRKTLASLK